VISIEFVDIFINVDIKMHQVPKLSYSEDLEEFFWQATQAAAINLALPCR
jgi:hypothetical protein